MKIARISKGNGKFRKIYIPNKQEQYELSLLKRKLDWLYLKLGIPNSVHGFVHGRNCVTNAEAHIGFCYTVSMDLTNFFDSVNYMHLDDIPTDILREVLVDGAPRQGLCTSPTVSNLALRNFDIEIENAAKLKDIAYTRYADDITLSGNDEAILRDFAGYVKNKLMEIGFVINVKKNKWQSSKGGRRIITGISVDDDVRASRKSRRKLRAAKHQENKAQAEGLQEWCYCTKPYPLEWVPEGTIDDPIITATYKEFRSGRKKPTRTFKGSRAVFKRYILRRMLGR